MNGNFDLRHYLPQFDGALLEALRENGSLLELPANTEILRENQYVRVIPIVLEGSVKVYTRYEDRELLLYYIRPAESCIMSFSAVLKNEPSRIYAITEEASTLFLLPVERVAGWLREFPRLNQLFYEQYNQRYSELLATVNQLLFTRLDERVYDFLKNQARMKGTGLVNLRHRQIATELGTAREVITRVIRKLEAEKKLRQTEAGIEIL